MSKMKAKAGSTPTFSNTFGAGLKQVAPNEHVKNGDTIISSTSGREHKVGHGNGTLKTREPNECCGCDGLGCAGCSGCCD
jgi:hypothetical protein